jgi:uncharacterized protein YecT (DUF1311 family)
MRLVMTTLLVLFAAPAWAQTSAPSAEELARQVGVAQPTIDADARAVSACLDAARDDGAMAACARLINDRCNTSAADVTTFGQWRCARRVRAAWAPSLAAARTALRGEGAGEDDAFDRGEAAWEQWRDSWCGFLEARLAGGSGAKVVLADCFAQTTIAHTIELKRAQSLY